MVFGNSDSEGARQFPCFEVLENFIQPYNSVQFVKICPTHSMAKYRMRSNEISILGIEFDNLQLEGTLPDFKSGKSSIVKSDVVIIQ